jgi:hypothetical protein
VRNNEFDCLVVPVNLFPHQKQNKMKKMIKKIAFIVLLLGTFLFAGNMQGQAQKASVPIPECFQPYNLRTYNSTFLWNPSFSAQYYTLQYKLASATTWTTVDFLYSTSYTATDLVPAEFYDWQVTSHCLDGESEPAISGFFAPSKCVVLQSLFASDITTSTARISWTVRNAFALQGTQIEYKPVSSATWINAYADGFQRSYLLTNLLPNTAYEWRLRSVCRSTTVLGEYIVGQNFTTLQVPCGVAPTGLIGESINFCGDVQMSWDAMPGAASYTLELKRTTSTTWIVLETALVQNYYQINLVPGLYDWRVKSNCFAQEKDNYSQSTVRAIFRPRSCIDLRTNSGKVKITANEKSKLKVSPQPANSLVNISFVAQKAGSIPVEIFNIDGKVLLTKNVSAVEGANQFQLDVSSLSNGIYLVRLQNGEAMETAKLVIQK